LLPGLHMREHHISRAKAIDKLLPPARRAGVRLNLETLSLSGDLLTPCMTCRIRELTGTTRRTGPAWGSRRMRSAPRTTRSFEDFPIVSA
jgi:hypothetical protein